MGFIRILYHTGFIPQQLVKTLYQVNDQLTLFLLLEQLENLSFFLFRQRPRLLQDLLEAVLDVFVIVLEETDYLVGQLVGSFEADVALEIEVLGAAELIHQSYQQRLDQQHQIEDYSIVQPTFLLHFQFFDYQFPCQSVQVVDDQSALDEVVGYLLALLYHQIPFVLSHLIELYPALFLLLGRDIGREGYDVGEFSYYEVVLLAEELFGLLFLPPPRFLEQVAGLDHLADLIEAYSATLHLLDHQDDHVKEVIEPQRVLSTDTVAREFEFGRAEVLDHISVIPFLHTVQVGVVTSYQLIKHDPKRIDVRLVITYIFQIGKFLRGNIRECAFPLLPKVMTLIKQPEPKIRQLVYPFLDQNICWLDILMEYLLVIESFVPSHALVEQVIYFLFFELHSLSPFVLNKLRESPFAVLHEDVVIVGGVHFQRNHSDNIQVQRDLAHDLKLSVNRIPFLVIVDLHDLHDQPVLGVLCIPGFVYCPECTFSYLLLDQDVVLLVTVLGLHQLH